MFVKNLVSCAQIVFKTEGNMVKFTNKIPMIYGRLG